MMRKVISFMHVSLDGFVTGPNGEMDWITIDEEIFQDAMDLAATADTALYGRTSYQMMEKYWPTVLAHPESTNLELQHALWVENINKIVFSTTLEKTEWNNTKLIRENIPDEIGKLKNEAGKSMMIVGSPHLTQSFMQWGLIDGYRLNIHPVLLKKGISLFKNINGKTDLVLLKTKTFRSGVVSLYYENR